MHVAERNAPVTDAQTHVERRDIADLAGFGQRVRHAMLRIPILRSAAAPSGGAERSLPTGATTLSAEANPIRLPSASKQPHRIVTL